jgi:hypothetical protein
MFGVLELAAKLAPRWKVRLAPDRLCSKRGNKAALTPPMGDAKQLKSALGGILDHAHFGYQTTSAKSKKAGAQHRNKIEASNFDQEGPPGDRCQKSRECGEPNSARRQRVGESRE